MSSPATDRCDECATTTGGLGLALDGLGLFHRECCQPCACGRLWPWSLVVTGDVVAHCVRCAQMGGGFHDEA